MIADAAPRRLLISFSGGETSAYMTLWILRNWRERYDEIRICFANTGEEWEATLEFVRECQEAFGWEVSWIEAIQFPGQRKSSGMKLVDFTSAARRGEPFREAIAKYGIPNAKFKGCTRQLKQRPIEAWARSIGWANGSYDTAIGIRADEIDRMSINAAANRLVYPLVGARVTKPQVNHFWSRQPFRLRLKGYQGNCKWCWKKSERKLLTIAIEAPEVFDFPAAMEEEFGKHGPEFLHDPATRRDPLPADYRRTFFRENRSARDIINKSRQLPPGFRRADDDKLDMEFDWELDLDAPGGCGESCEVFSDEADEEPEPEALA